MKLALFVDQFPITSQTFVTNQVTGLLDAGIDLTIISVNKQYSVGAGELANIHPKLAERGRVIYLIDESENATKHAKLARRFLGVAKGLLTSATRSKVLASLGNQYGHHGKSLLLANMVNNIVTNTNTSLNFDIVLCHFGHNGILAHKLRKLGVLTGKIATIFHGYDISSKPALDKHLNDYKKLIVDTELLLPISNLWLEKLISIGADKSKINVHRMGVDLSLFTFDESTLDKKVNDYASQQEYRLFTVARFSEKKGLEYAINALALLPKHINVHYYLAGFGELEPELKALVVNLNLADKVSFLGTLNSEQVKAQMAQADFFIQPSITAQNGDMEGVPVAIMEAMACGVPVLSTIHSGIPELVEHGVSGMLSPEKDAKSLANYLTELIEQPALSSTIAQNARARIEQVADISQLNKQLIETLQDLLD